MSDGSVWDQQDDQDPVYVKTIQPKMTPLGGQSPNEKKVTYLDESGKLVVGDDNPNYIPPKPDNPEYDQARVENERAQTELYRAQAGRVGMATPRDSAAIGADTAQAGYYGAQTDKIRQEMQGAQALALQQHYNVIGALQKQLAEGQTTPAEADKLMQLSKANLEAAMKGTTPFQMDQEKSKRENESRSQANTYIKNQLDTGSQMATGLVGGLGTIYGKILGGQADVPYNFNPMQIAQDYTQQLSGGSELSTLALNILKGAFGGAQ
jgi:hypothetical protein